MTLNPRIRRPNLNTMKRLLSRLAVWRCDVELRELFVRSTYSLNVYGGMACRGELSVWRALS